MCYGPQHMIWLCAMGHSWLCAMGHSTGSGCVLWATAQDLVACFGPQHRIWLSAMGHNTGSDCVLWATSQDLVVCYGPQHRIWLCTLGHTTCSRPTRIFAQNLSKFEKNVAPAMWTTVLNEFLFIYNSNIAENNKSSSILK